MTATALGFQNIMWGRLATCGGLLIRLPQPHNQLPHLIPQTGQSSGAPALRTVAANVFDRDRMVPRNVIRRNAKACSQALALRRTGGVVAGYNGLNQFRI